jgi:hypothetical protein
MPPGSPGNINGAVISRDTLSVTSSPDQSGVRVSLEGTNFSATTDSNGYWQMQNVPVGTYVLTCEKNGYGTKKIYNIQHTGNGTLYLNTITISQLPRVNVDVVMRSFEDVVFFRKDSVWYDSLGQYHTLYLYDTVSQGKADYTVTISSGIVNYINRSALKAVLFFSRNKDIDPNVSSTYDTFSSGYATDTLGYPIVLLKNALLNLGYRSGEKVFTRAGVSLIENYNDYGYYDHALRQFVYTGLGLNYSQVKSFIMP